MRAGSRQRDDRPHASSSRRTSAAAARPDTTSLAVLNDAARSPELHQAPRQSIGDLFLAASERRDVPFRLVRLLGADEGRFAPDAEMNAGRAQVFVDPIAESQDRGPLRLAVGLRHARPVDDARHAHLEVELAFDLLDGAGDRRGGDRIRRRRERDVALGREQARGRIEADPAGTGDITFAPGMEIGEIARRPGRALDRLLVGRELDQVAGNETCGDVEAAQDLHEQAGRIAAGAATELERFGRRLHARIHAHDVVDRGSDRAIGLDEQMIRIAGSAVELRNEGLEGRRRR